MKSIRLSQWLLLLTMTVAAALRFWALKQGLPNPGVDEPQIMDRALTMMKTGNFNPHFFDYPGFLIYVHFVIATVHFLYGAVTGTWASLDQAHALDFYLWSRAFTATLSTLTVLFVYFIGRRWSVSCGLVAALLVAVFPNVVRESHFALTDIPLMFFVTAAWLASLRLSERYGMQRLIAASVLAGLALSSKYPGIFAVILPLTVVALAGPRDWRGRLRHVSIVCGVFVATFLITSPYTWLDLPAFLDQFAHLSAVFRTTPPEAPWLSYIKYFSHTVAYFRMSDHSYWAPFFYWAVFPSLAVALWELRRRQHRAFILLMLIVPTVLYIFISRQNIVYARYILPLVPFLAMIVAVGVAELVQWFESLRWPVAANCAATALVVALLSAMPAWNSFALDRGAAKTWTPAEAYEWINEHVAPKSMIELEGREVLLDETKYRVRYDAPAIANSYEWYVAQGFDYVMVSSESYKQKALPVAYRELTQRMELLADFEASNEHPGSDLRIFRIIR